MDRVYQLTPLKRACLEHCSSPAGYFTEHWCDGRSGAFQMGLTRGTYCLGCCWVLMVLLFAGSIMNLVWIADLAIIVFVGEGCSLGHTFRTWPCRTYDWRRLAAVARKDIIRHTRQYEKRPPLEAAFIVHELWQSANPD